MKVQAPSSVKALYLKLRAEAPAEEQLGEIPEVFRSSETQPAIELQVPVDSGVGSTTPTEPSTIGSPAPFIEASKSKRRGRKPIVLKISKADLLEQRWLKPATRVAEELRLSHSSLLQKCRNCGLGPFLPPENYWRSRKSGDPIVIPVEIQAVIAQLRAEAVCASELAVIPDEQPETKLNDAVPDQSLPPGPALTKSGREADSSFREIPFPALPRVAPAGLELRVWIAIGRFGGAFQHLRCGPSASYVDLAFGAQRLSGNTGDKRNVWAPTRAKPPPSGECVSFGQYIYIYIGLAELAAHYSPS